MKTFSIDSCEPKFSFFSSFSIRNMNQKAAKEVKQYLIFWATNCGEVYRYLLLMSCVWVIGFTFKMQKHSSSENWITKVDVVDEFDFPDFILDFVAAVGGAFFAILSRSSLTQSKCCTLFFFTSRYERNFNSFKFRHLTPILNNEENNNKCFFHRFESFAISKVCICPNLFWLRYTLGVFETWGYATIAINTIRFLESLSVHCVFWFDIFDFSLSLFLWIFIFFLRFPFTFEYFALKTTLARVLWDNNDRDRMMNELH